MNTNVGKKKYKTGKYLTQNKLIERWIVNVVKKKKMKKE